MIRSPNTCAPSVKISNCGIFKKARLVKLVDTSDLKSDFSIKSIGSSPITSIKVMSLPK